MRSGCRRRSPKVEGPTQPLQPAGEGSRMADRHDDAAIQGPGKPWQREHCKRILQQRNAMSESSAEKCAQIPGHAAHVMEGAQRAQFVHKVISVGDQFPEGRGVLRLIVTAQM